MAKLIVLATLLLIGINGWSLEGRSSQVSALSIGYELIAAMLDTLNANVQKANELSEEQFKVLKEELASIRETVRSIESRTKESSSGQTDSNADNRRTVQSTEARTEENSVTTQRITLANLSENIDKATKNAFYETIISYWKNN
ncbi:uncharacterized protein LOC129742182 [Uranotaenia lowii]|uniref:uncharacterized protein LOC129742182 n=1 Tax=Uranotaenia lowii TaxID=190385 RepID=UPI00247A4F83|nr:uncharacterized protein LOC129742182 [Uranotaenia lowii]